MIKYFHSAMAGAPVLSGSAGAMLGVLDACLVNGFGLKTLDTLVVAGGIATMTIASGHSFEVDTVAVVSGATPSGLNGEKKILSVSTTTATFDATGISDQTATGSISAKLSPLGFAKSFTGTNKAVYRSADVTGTRMSLRVDDTGTTNARVVGYESMSDVDTGVAPFPTESQNAGGRYWPKSNAASSATRPWTVIGDGKTFYLHVYSGVATSDIGGFVASFGDFSSERSGDPYAAMLTGAVADVTNLATQNINCVGYNGSTSGATGHAPRSYTFLGGSVAAFNRGESFFLGVGMSGALESGIGGFPNPVNNGMYLSPILVYENPNLLRGRNRGGLMSPQAISGAFDHRQKIDGRGTLTGRKLMAVKCCVPAGTKASSGTMFFDITGPWA